MEYHDFLDILLDKTHHDLTGNSWSLEKNGLLEIIPISGRTIQLKVKYCNLPGF